MSSIAADGDANNVACNYYIGRCTHHDMLVFLSIMIQESAEPDTLPESWTR